MSDESIQNSIESLIKLGWKLLFPLVGMLLAWPFMWMWNYTVPVLFHGPVIDSWLRAWCLVMVVHWILPSQTFFLDKPKRNK